MNLAHFIFEAGRAYQYVVDMAWQEGNNDGINACAGGVKEFMDFILQKNERDRAIIELPCKLGDTVYVVGTKCLANIDISDEYCDITDCKKCVYDAEYVVFSRMVDDFLLFYLIFGNNPDFIFNKTVFLTEAEAEQALEARK